MRGIERDQEFAAYLLCGDWHWADDLTQITFVRLAQGWSPCGNRRRWTPSPGPA